MECMTLAEIFATTIFPLNSCTTVLDGLEAEINYISSRTCCAADCWCLSSTMELTTFMLVDVETVCCRLHPSDPPGKPEASPPPPPF